MNISDTLHLHRRGLCLLLFIISLVVKGQITITPTSGCAPLAVQLSGPAGATGVHWTLGSGMGTSSLANPNPLYTNPGTYNITYTAMVGGNPVSYSGQVVVTAGPSGSYSFLVPATHCAPMTVTLSGTGGSAGSTYQWSFGDLTPLGSGSNLTHTYNQGGAFIPVMTIVDAVTGCTAVASNASGTVFVSTPPTLSISSLNYFFACAPPFNTVLSASMSVSNSPKTPSLSNFTWSLSPGSSPTSGSGVTLGAANFSSAGSYTVWVSATDDNQCAGSTSSVINVISSTLSLIVTPTVCWGNVVDYSLTSSEPTKNVYWNIPTFNTSFTSYDPFPVISYSVPGYHTMTVMVIPGGVCPPLTATASIFIEKVVADFTLTPPHSTCQPSMVITYSNLSTTNTSHTLTSTWYMKGKGMATYTPSGYVGTTPSFTVTQNSTNPYTIYTPFISFVELEVESSSIAHCKSETVNFWFDTLMRPTAFFYTNAKRGCAPHTVKFNDTSFTMDNFSHAVKGYTLFNGAVPSVSISGSKGAVFPYNFTYPAPGTYTPWMIIETFDGCIDTSFVDTVVVVSQPTVSMTYTPNLKVCAGENVQVNLSALPSPSVINQWHVISDARYFSGCVNDPNPIFPFTHTGVHGFTVSAVNQGCASTLAAAQTITVTGPYGKFSFENTCIAGQRKNVTFYVYLQEAGTATLNFGDGNSVAITGNVTGSASYSISHTYGSSGNYTAILTSQNNSSGCANHVFTRSLKIRDIKARIQYNGHTPPALPKAIGCASERYVFTADSSSDEMVRCYKGFAWTLFNTFDSIPTKNKTASTFTSPPLSGGVHTLVLGVKDENDCFDYDTVLIRASSAKPTFTFASNPICFDQQPLVVLNTSQANQAYGDTITKTTWNFGDDTAAFFTYTNPLVNPTHTYTFVLSPSSQFIIKVVAQNNVGCIDSTQQMVQVNLPLPLFSVNDAFPCLPKYGKTNVKFSAATGYATYSVNYGYGGPWVTSTTFSNVSYNYLQPGTFNATLTVIDSDGCRASEGATINVIGQPTAGIIFPDNENKFCVPATPTLISNSVLYQTVITNTIWSIGNVSTPAPGTGTFINQIFVVPTVTTIVLKVDVDGHCPSTASAQIIIADPKAQIRLNKYKFCLNDTLKISMRDTNAVGGWKWFFGDNVAQQEILAGTVLAALTRTISYPYYILPSDSAGNTVLALRYYGTAGACVRSATTGIQVIKIESDFKSVNDNYAHCLGVTDQFIGTSKNPALLAYQYNWRFGDNTQGSGLNISHVYQQPGTYSVMLITSDSQLGCPDTAVKKVTVFPLPQATLAASDTLFCPADTFMLSGSAVPGISGPLTGTLNPTQNFSFSPANTFTIPVGIQNTTTYYFQVTDENLCVSPAATVQVKVQPPPPSRQWDTTIIRGQTVQLNAFMGSNFTYSWTPEIAGLSCDSCYNPITTSTANITYSVEIKDLPLKCFNIVSTFRVIIDERVTLDVPTAFTPNGDGVNDVIYADGWGLRKLIYFRIYNRWGQLIFESNDLKTGWDGTFQGVRQNVETYVYQVAAETFKEETLTKTGSFKLLR